MNIYIHYFHSALLSYSFDVNLTFKYKVITLIKYFYNINYNITIVIFLFLGQKTHEEVYIIHKIKNALSFIKIKVLNGCVYER